MGYNHCRYMKMIGTDLVLVDTSGNRVLEFLFDTAGTPDISKIYGAPGTGVNSRLSLYANPTDTFPYLMLVGTDDVQFHIAVGASYRIYDGTVPIQAISYASNVSTVGGANVTGDDLVLKGNGIDADNITIEGGGDIALSPTGNVKFGAYTGTPATDSTGYITIKDSAGNTRKLMVQA